ncbi:MAG: hypothetical protein R3F39_10250 [Myxococcota bacterium]
MSQDHIRAAVVRRALAEMGGTFRTKELSGHALMLDGHPELRDQRNYHAWVGRYLSAHCTDVVRTPASNHPDGAMWINQVKPGAAPGPRVAANPAVAPSARTVETGGGQAADLGPQSASDNGFTARMRRHQSWYRASVLNVPCGTGPQPASTSAYGNMLRSDDGQRGLNFLTPEIHRVALERLEDRTGVIEPFRLLHNMLSSQPMCFNVFGPLVRDLKLATRLMQTVPGLQVGEVRDVRIEFAPQPASEYLGDRTAFDAFIDYRRTDGTRAFLGIETKLTEPFSAKHYDSPDYRRWMKGAGSPWRADAQDQADAVRHNQLWRDHLLAMALRDHRGSPYEHGTLVLVRHPLDRSCERVVDGYRRLLVDGDQTFVDYPLDRLVAGWRQVEAGEACTRWLADLEKRYLDLHASEGSR